MWVCRAGIKAKYFDKFISTSCIYLAWENFSINLDEYTSRLNLKDAIKEIMCSDNRTSVANWTGQAFAFGKEMKKGDYVLIPHTRSQKYTLGIIVGDYEYLQDSCDGLFHRRKIRIVRKDIPKEIFDQSTKYSLGAFRTIFKVRDESIVLECINKKMGAF